MAPMAKTQNGQGGDGGQHGSSDRLRAELQNLLAAVGDRAASSVRDKVGGMTGRLADYADGGGGTLTAAIKGARDVAEGKSPARAMLSGGMSMVKDKAKNMLGGGRGGKGKSPKVTTIVESVDIGVPVQVAYNQWTQFTDFPKFMKKVENVEQESDEKLNWRAQIFFSHRSWESTIIQQVPDDKIVWRSQGQKGHVDGAVTFHALAPNLTRVLLTLEYHPQGFFEHTGNLWRAQGRRARLELKHFQRHVMTDVITHPDDVEGWRGTIGADEDSEQESGRERPREQARGDREPATRKRASRDGEGEPPKRAPGRAPGTARRGTAARPARAGSAAQGDANGDGRPRRRSPAGESGKGATPVRRRASAQEGQRTRRSSTRPASQDE
jgi:uncharacterized membrane protein